MRSWFTISENLVHRVFKIHIFAIPATKKVEFCVFVYFEERTRSCKTGSFNKQLTNDHLQLRIAFLQLRGSSGGHRG